MRQSSFSNFRLKSLWHEGEIVDLKEKVRLSAKETLDNVATVLYDIYLHDSHQKIGTIDIRLTMNDHMYYYGHVGYHILEKYRGHRYAFYACKILLGIARDEFKMDHLIITCNPDNYASLKTIERLGAELIEHVAVPKEHELYRLGDKEKLIYKVRL